MANNQAEGGDEKRELAEETIGNVRNTTVISLTKTVLVHTVICPCVKSIPIKMNTATA